MKNKHDINDKFQIIKILFESLNIFIKTILQIGKNKILIIDILLLVEKIKIIISTSKNIKWLLGE